MKKFHILFLLAVLVAAGCSELENLSPDDPDNPGETPESPAVTPTLTIETTDWSFAAEGGSVEVSFEVNVDWRALADCGASVSNWLTLTPAKGRAGRNELILTAEANPRSVVRWGSMTIVYGSKLQVLTVKQAGKSPDESENPENPDDPDDPTLTPVLTIETTDWSFAAEGGSVEVPFEVNVDWTASVDCGESAPAWLTLTPESGEAGKGVLTLTAERNFEASQRRTSVHILYGEKSCELTVVQSEMTDDTNITDAFNPLFAQELQKRGYIADATHITIGEVRGITSVDVSEGDSGPLTSLQGLEYFTNLETLECSFNQLTSLDVSKNTKLVNLTCICNQLTSLDVSGSTNLESLWCSNNQLTSLDVFKNTALKTLSCSSNQLTSLNVSGNTNLVSLSCGNNQLASLNVSGCTMLRGLNCSYNQLASLNISKNTKISYLDCKNNPGDGAKYGGVFPVSAWFNNNSIPKTSIDSYGNVVNCNFTTGSWGYWGYVVGRTVTVDYRRVW